MCVSVWGGERANTPHYQCHNGIVVEVDVCQSEHSLTELVLSSHRVGSGDGTPVGRLGGKAFHTPAHPPPSSVFILSLLLLFLRKPLEACRTQPIFIFRVLKHLLLYRENQPPIRAPQRTPFRSLHRLTTGQQQSLCLLSCLVPHSPRHIVCAHASPGILK